MHFLGFQNLKMWSRSNHKEAPDFLEQRMMVSFFLIVLVIFVAKKVYKDDIPHLILHNKMEL